MKTSFWRRWCNSLRSTQQTGRVLRVKPRRRFLCLEPLEDRAMLSLMPQMVLDINPGDASASPSQMVAIGSTTYFSANDGVKGTELWKSDGTAAGTTLVKDINPGNGSSVPLNLTNVNGTLFFTARDADWSGWKLWKSDGTEAGTVQVFVWRSSNPTNVNGTLFFDSGELWKSDGTEAGTVLVKDIYPGTHRVYDYYGYQDVQNSSSPTNLTNVNGMLFFTADDGTNGRELWKSDGTEAGTVLVKDINPGINSSSSSNLTNVNGTLFFSANGGTIGTELWKSDGTAAGTVLVKDINPWGSSYFGALTDVNGTLFFSANDGTNGNELWKSDGTAAGTTLVKDIYPGGFTGGYGNYLNNSDPSNLTNVNGTLFFTAQDGTNGRELWKSDGTAAGTTLVKDIEPGDHIEYYYDWYGRQSRSVANNSNPGSLTSVNGTLFFMANDGTGTKLWQSDGSEAGTVLVANLVASGLTNVNGMLFFSADDGVHGQELWTLVDRPPTLSVNDVAVTEGNTGTRTASFAVTLSAAVGQPVTVAYATANGSATAGSDYQITSGTLTILAGQTTGTITVMIYGDRLAELNETFVVNLSSPTNATIADGQGVGTIIDDEPRISINDVTVTEGNTGAVNATFTVNLSVAYDVAVTVHFQTASVSATAGSDYAAASGDVIIAAGQTSKTFTVAVIGDRLAEPTENFVVNLSAATNWLIVDSQGVGTILDNEPRISIIDVTKQEGRKNQTTLFTFTITLSAAYDQAVTMSFKTVNGTATTSNSDYIAKIGTLTFAPGETTKTITITVKGDSKREAHESFFVDLYNNSLNSLFTKNRGLGTILNDD